MRAEPSSRFDYTECEMADAFERFVLGKRGLPGVGRVSKLFREVSCQQGRPDFVALMGPKHRFLKGSTVSLKLAGSIVLSLLHEGAGRTSAYLCEHSGLSLRSVQQALSELVRHRYVKCTGSGTYVANPSSSLQTVEVIAIELKLDRPRRAIFQAQQCRAFAQRVLIVVPPSQLGTYRKYKVALRRWGIGIATFDPVSGEFDLRRKPRSGRPHSKQHQAYAKFQLLHDASRA
ncbi:MAG: hypothetical protein AB7Q17_14675 [Phycisphaerae bacterium]